MIRSRLIVAEALRLYAHSHQGRLPSSLDDLSDTPAPLDPFSDKPFGYLVEQTADGQVATLTSVTPDVYESIKSFKITLPKAGQ